MQAKYADVVMSDEAITYLRTVAMESEALAGRRS
jgi:hypothetical protein